ncbi:hypothetical protein BpHYR1_027849 [Brachionus plicatilis]|uniref:Uncharacterized protein n=1 Tax=Brachionus plicatilis TaxID=10195 RepID=A0A3M7RPC1_BRAPC|nr:hypothetical protein BpHYR1_027849 [Brachionus plicatilis]
MQTKAINNTTRTNLTFIVPKSYWSFQFCPKYLNTKSMLLFCSNRRFFYLNNFLIINLCIIDRITFNMQHLDEIEYAYSNRYSNK